MTARYVYRNQTFKKYSSDAPRTGTVFLEVDWEKIIATLGRKAAFNRTRKSGLAFGIKVTFKEAKQ